MSRRRSTRLKQVPVQPKPKFGWLTGKKHRRFKSTNPPDPSSPAAKELRANEELIDEARGVGLIGALSAKGMPVAHTVAVQLIEAFPYVVVAESQTRLEAATLFARRKLTRNQRYFKKEIEEGIKVAESALTIARLAIEARTRQTKLVGAHPR